MTRPDPTNTDGDASAIEAIVDLALFHVVARPLSGPVQRRLVMRRTVYAVVAADDPVDELWISTPHRHQREVAELIRALAPIIGPLLRAEPIAKIDGLASARQLDLDEPRSPAPVDLVIQATSRVVDLTGRRRALEADASFLGSYLGTVARAMFETAARAADLRVAFTGDGGPTDSDPTDTDPTDTDPTDRDATDEDDQLPAAIVRAALDQDLRDAQARYASQQRWTHIVATPLELVPEPGEARGRGEGPTWMRWRRAAPEGAAASRADYCEDHTAVLVGVQGVSVGKDNMQSNLFRFRLRPTIDLSSMFDDPAVRQALSAFARNPDDARRQLAVTALRSFGTSRRSEWGDVEERFDPVPRTSTDVSGDPMLAGTVLICDCRDVQVGNHMRQYNTFVGVVTPTLEVADLFRMEPGLVGLLVDYACAGRGIGRVRDELVAAVCGVANTALPTLNSDRVYPESLRIKGGRGVGVGDVRQIDAREVAVCIPRAVDRALQRVQPEPDEVLGLSFDAPGSFDVPGPSGPHMEQSRISGPGRARGTRAGGPIRRPLGRSLDEPEL